MSIRGKLVTLRAPELTDLSLLHKWSNDEDLWACLGGWHFPFSSRSTEEWIRSRKDNNLSDHVFCIEAPELGMLGTANLVQIDWKNRNAFHGMMLGDDAARGQGFALDTVMTLMRYAFDELGLQRLDTDIIAGNQRSMDFYTRKCGWVVEGVRRNWHYRGGRYHDKVLLGITREEYLRLIEQTSYWSESKS
jgi:RimJ/RimL family protein N-acetyltransferase